MSCFDIFVTVFVIRIFIDLNEKIPVAYDYYDDKTC